VHHTIQRALVFNKHWNKGKNIVDNCFKILKKIFGELFLKTNLQFIFFFDVIICFDIFQHSILDGRDLDIEALMIQLELDNKVMHVKNVVN
jgi:hypothetical protein